MHVAVGVRPSTCPSVGLDTLDAGTRERLGKPSSTGRGPTPSSNTQPSCSSAARSATVPARRAGHRRRRRSDRTPVRPGATNAMTTARSCLRRRADRSTNLRSSRTPSGSMLTVGSSRIRIDGLLINASATQPLAHAARERATRRSITSLRPTWSSRNSIRSSRPVPDAVESAVYWRLSRAVTSS